MSNGRRAVSVVDAVFAACAVATLCAVLSPVVATSRGASSLATCQVNMQRLGGAMRMYLSDWDRTYPTNRLLSNVGPSASSSPNVEVPLAQPGVDAATGKPFRSTYGICWVEGLYSYLEPVTSPGLSPSVWKCPSASSVQAGTTSTARMTAAVSYAINFNLLEQPEATSRQDSTLMLLREMDRLVASSARGGARSGSTATQVFGPTDGTPVSPFLNKADTWLIGVGPMEANLHGSGSNILFADGHVKLFDAAHFPFLAAYDTVSGRWTNPSRTVSITRPRPSIQQH